MYTSHFCTKNFRDVYKNTVQQQQLIFIIYAINNILFKRMVHLLSNLACSRVERVCENQEIFINTIAIPRLGPLLRKLQPC